MSYLSSLSEPLPWSYRQRLRFGNGYSCWLRHLRFLLPRPRSSQRMRRPAAWCCAGRPAIVVDSEFIERTTAITATVAALDKTPSLLRLDKDLLIYQLLTSAGVGLRVSTLPDSLDSLVGAFMRAFRPSYCE